MKYDGRTVELLEQSEALLNRSQMIAEFALIQSTMLNRLHEQSQILISETRSLIELNPDRAVPRFKTAVGR